MDARDQQITGLTERVAKLEQLVSDLFSALDGAIQALGAEDMMGAAAAMSAFVQDGEPAD